MTKPPLLPLLLGGAAALGLGVVAGNVAAASRKPRQVHPERFSSLAAKYDAALGPSERRLGVDDERKRLLSRASGRVLEVAAGTWRNAEAYDPTKVQSLVLTDASAAMCEQARAKAAGSAMPVRVEAVGVDDLPRFFQGQQFDTIVDTFGVCSFRDPPAALRAMVGVLAPGGRLLLLEHGRVENPAQWGAAALNWFLDLRAGAHAEEWGCLHNRAVLEAVRAAGLDVLEVRYSQMSTVVAVVAAPSSAPAAHEADKA